MRITILDGWRGLLLVFMTASHLEAVLGVFLAKLTMRALGWVESAQGFVFISGLVVGLVYGGILRRRGAGAMGRAFRARIATIWGYQAGLVLVFLAAALVLARTGWQPAVLAPYVAEPVFFTLASLGLVTASMHMGILPMYVVFMLAAPFVLRAFDRGGAGSVALASLALWLLAQTGLMDALTRAAEQAAAAAGHEALFFGIYFNVLGWQVLFVTGLWIGWLLATGRLDPACLRSDAARRLALVCFALFVAFGLFDRAVHWTWISEAFSARALALADRQDFSIVHLLNFAVDLYLVAWLMAAGSRDPWAPVRWLAALVERVVSLRFLVFLGQHSLQVFAFHLLVVYVVAVLTEGRAVSEAAGTLVLVAGVAALALPAALHAGWVRRGKAFAAASVTEPGAGARRGS